MNEVVIVSAVRTAVGNFLETLILNRRQTNFNR